MKIVYVTITALFINISCYASLDLAFEQIGDDIHFSFSGTIDLSGIEEPQPGDSSTLATDRGQISSTGFLTGGDGNGEYTIYRIRSGDELNFATNFSFLKIGIDNAINVTGDQFGIDSRGGAEADFFLPFNYIFGENLSGSMIFPDQKIPSFLTQEFSGQRLFEWTNNSGNVVDFVTISAVPEPSVVATLSGAILVAVFLRKRRQ